MSHEFLANYPPKVVVTTPKEPLDKGGFAQKDEASKEKVEDPPQQVSFRDKVLGKYVPPPIEEINLVAAILVRIEHVSGNRLLPMLHVDKKLVEDRSEPPLEGCLES